MKFNSGEITVVIAIAAIISPVIVAIINDYFTYQLKKNEYALNIQKNQLEHQRNADKLKAQQQDKMRTLISSFVASANKCYQHIQVDDFGSLINVKQQFADDAANLFVVLSPAKQKQVINWLNRSNSREKSEWLDLIREINSEAPKLLKAVNNK